MSAPMAAADSEANLPPFYVGNSKRNLAWASVDRWVPVDSERFPYAFDRWLARKATRWARTKKPARDYIRSSRKCRPRYMELALVYLHQKLLHAPLRELSEDMCQYLLEIALQLVILHRERRVHMDDAAAVFARAMPMADRSFRAHHLVDWWEYGCQSNPLFAVFQFGTDDAAAVRQRFGNKIDVVALDNLRILRFAMQRAHMEWKFEVEEADGSGAQTVVCSLDSVRVFFLSVTIHAEHVDLLPVSGESWEGTMKGGRRVKLRMAHFFNQGVRDACDPEFPDYEPRAPPEEPDSDEDDMRPVAVDADDVDPENNANDRVWFPGSPMLDDGNPA